MRKLSKSRTEEEGAESSNGSTGGAGGAGEVQDAANGGSGEEAREDAGDESKEEEGVKADQGGSATESSPAPRDPPKKRGASARKSQRAKKDKKPHESDDEEEEEPEKEYEVEEIIDSKKVKGKLHYLIHWKGYSSASDSWETADSVSCPDLVAKFKENGPKSTKKAAKRKASVTPSKKIKKSRPAGVKNNSKQKNDFDYENADSEAEYEVERILEVHHKKSGKREFLIHWKGWSSKYDSWEPEEHLSCSELINKFMSKVNKARDTEQRTLRVAPKVTPRFTLQQKTTGRRLSKRSGQRQRVRYDDTE